MCASWLIVECGGLHMSAVMPQLTPPVPPHRPSSIVITEQRSRRRIYVRTTITVSRAGPASADHDAQCLAPALATSTTAVVRHPAPRRSLAYITITVSRVRAASADRDATFRSQHCQDATTAKTNRTRTRPSATAVTPEYPTSPHDDGGSGSSAIAAAFIDAVQQRFARAAGIGHVALSRNAS